MILYPIKIVERSGTSDAISTTDSISQPSDPVNRQFSVSGDDEAVFYDVVDLTPTTFEIKNADSSTAATTQNAIGAIYEESAIDSISQPSDSVNRHLGYPMIRITKRVERLIGDFDYI